MARHMCQLCSDLDGSPLAFSTTDEQNNHAQIHLLQLGYTSDDDRLDVKQIFDRCFPSQSIEMNSDADERSRSILLKRCHYVLKNRNNDSDPLICQECGKSVPYIRVSSDGGRRIYTCSILEHACGHLDKKPYGCRYCNYGASWYANIYDHLKRMHKILSPTRNKDILERWAFDFDAIEVILSKCYDGFDQDSKETSQEHLIERQRYCFELVRKYATIDKKIECQLCRKAVFVRDKHNFDDKKAIQHIWTHLKKAIFKCKKCSTSYKSCSGAYRHAKRHHTCSSTEIIEDRSGTYHAEIMDLLTKCFDSKKTTAV